jgi:nucleotide-binding universal stress UspA family protein
MPEGVIIVPLDGSELSERALSYAVLFAEKMKKRVLLVTIWEGAEEALTEILPDVAGDLFKAGQEYYTNYLKDVAKRHATAGVKIDAEVILGKPADEIVKLAEERDTCFVAFATHGRSGLSRWWSGSVASELARRLRVPRLMVGPKVLAQSPKQIVIDAVLVPLDGSPRSEAALPAATEVANLFGAKVHLAEVLSPTSQAFFFDMPSPAAIDVQQELQKAAAAYLKKTGAALSGADVESKVLLGAPADALIDHGEEQGVDLVVMASHGRGGIARVTLGSVADRMVSQSPAPVYLVRPEDAG